MRLVTVSFLFFSLAAALAAQPCDPSETDEVCPDTTDWHRYFPLDVGLRPAGPHEARLDLGDLRAGLYLLRLRSNGSKAARRFVVVR